MPVLQLDDQQFPLPPVPIRIGAGADVDIALPSDAVLGVQAVIDRAGGSALVIRRAVPSALVRVNGVVLGAEPTPLMHGDKVEIGGLELRFADDTKGGATQFVNAQALAEMIGPRRGSTSRATAASGGRVVSLVDGKEYLVPGAGVVIGRDASCDIVVGQNEVSRRHAEIAPDEAGYLVRDMSANGVFVNGERVQGSRRLMRSDVLRIGGEEFRFYADIAAPAPPPPAAEPPASVPVRAEPAAVAIVAPVVPTVPAGPLAQVPAHAAPLTAPPTGPSPVAVDDARPVLAMLEALNEGLSKGTRYPLRSALSHVGRGAHNDIRLVEESVSESHAKLQRREDGWFLVDMDSTNGSYVGGTRVKGERRIDGQTDVRFGGVKMRFSPVEAAGAAGQEGKGTRAIASVDRQRPRVPEPSAAAPAASSGGMSAWVWVVVVAVVVAAAFFVLKGRA